MSNLFFFKMYLLMKAKIHGKRREGKEQGCRYEIDKKEAQWSKKAMKRLHIDRMSAFCPELSRTAVLASSSKP